MYEPQYDGSKWGNDKRPILGEPISHECAGMMRRGMAFAINVPLAVLLFDKVFGAVPTLFSVVLVAFLVLNSVIMPSLTGQSLGYLICGLKVAALGKETRTGDYPMYYAGFVRLTIRRLLVMVNIITIWGLFPPMFQRHGQSFADQMCRIAVFKSHGLELDVRHPRFNAAAA